MFAALFCNLGAKFFRSYRDSMGSYSFSLASEYISWILADIAFLLGVELMMSIICFRWRRNWVFRSVLAGATLICTWSVINASWLIRMGTQILPTVLLPLVRDPLNSLGIIGVNLSKMPIAAFVLLFPSGIALTFIIFVLSKPRLPAYNRRKFFNKLIVSFIIMLIAFLGQGVFSKQGSIPISSIGLRYNCQFKALTSFISSDNNQLTTTILSNLKRDIPVSDEIEVIFTGKGKGPKENVVIVVLEGVQYNYTSLGDKKNELTPYLKSLAVEGVEFCNMRSTLTHTTKALFSLLTGRYPSAYQDLAETVPVLKSYASIVTILKENFNYRTAFFQSAKGNFECRPGLVHNLGFDIFWSRDNLNDPDSFIGYLGSDEFSMLKPITEWIQTEESPFFVTILCSVTHDPYEVPEWFSEPASDAVERYRQSISYTDQFISALNLELSKLGLIDKTIFCVVGDHGEAFGEHGLLGHERIAFEEALRIPWIIRSPSLPEVSQKVTAPTSSVDLVPTLLGLLGLESINGNFDGIDALGSIIEGRKVYFSGWMHQGPAGFIQGNQKIIYNPTTDIVSFYDLSTDPGELNPLIPDEYRIEEIAQEIVRWRKDSIFNIQQEPSGKRILFDSWLCRWTNRVSSAKYKPYGFSAGIFGVSNLVHKPVLARD